MAMIVCDRPCLLRFDQRGMRAACAGQVDHADHRAAAGDVGLTLTSAI